MVSVDAEILKKETTPWRNRKKHSFRIRELFLVTITLYLRNTSIMEENIFMGVPSSKLIAKNRDQLALRKVCFVGLIQDDQDWVHA